MDRRADRAGERGPLVATRTTARPRRVALAVALAATTVAGAACSTPPTAAAPPRPRQAGTTTTVDTSPSTSTPSPTTVAPTTTLPPLAIPAQPLRVGSRSYDWIDETRETPTHGRYRAHDRRELVTTIWYPALGAPSSSVHRGAEPDRAAGPFPIVLFAHGHDGEPVDYLDDIARWVSRGYVVVAPAFPLSRRGAPGGPSFADLREQPGDLSFVLTQVLQMNAQPDSWFHGLLDARRVAAIGHSEGAWTVLALAGDSCCHDPRVKAAVVYAGAMAPAFQYKFFTVGAPPLLFAHTLDDDIVPYKAGLSAYEAAPAPKYFVTVAHGGHLDSFDALATPTGATVLRITDQFLDHYVKGHTTLKIASPHPELATLNQRLRGS